MSVSQVLVVEDEEAIRRAVIEYLGDHGCVRVDGARDGLDALHHILSRRYRVVILDLMMPKMSGGDFLDSVQAMISDPSLNFQGDAPAVIIVTGATEADLPSSIIASRYPRFVRAVFRKPVDLGALMQAVEEELGG